MCMINHGKHRFSIPLTGAEINAYHGQPIYVHGISPIGNGNLILEESGSHAVP